MWLSHSVALVYMENDENPWVQALEVINSALGEPPSAGAEHAKAASLRDGKGGSSVPTSAPISSTLLVTTSSTSAPATSSLPSVDNSSGTSNALAERQTSVVTSRPSRSPEQIIQAAFDRRPAIDRRSPSPPLPSTSEFRRGSRTRSPSFRRSPSPLQQRSSLPDNLDEFKTGGLRAQSPNRGISSARAQSPDRGIPSNSERRASEKILRFELVQEALNRQAVADNGTLDSVDEGLRNSGKGVRSTTSGPPRTSPRFTSNSTSGAVSPNVPSRRVSSSNSVASLPDLPVTHSRRGSRGSAASLSETQSLDLVADGPASAREQGARREGKSELSRRGSKSEPASPRMDNPRKNSWTKSRAKSPASKERSPSPVNPFLKESMGEEEANDSKRGRGRDRTRSKEGDGNCQILRSQRQVDVSSDTASFSKRGAHGGSVKQSTESESTVLQYLQNTLAAGTNQLLEQASQVARDVAHGRDGADGSSILGEKVDEADAFWAEMLDKQSLLLERLAAENQSLRAEAATRTRLQAPCASPRQALEEKRVRTGLECAFGADSKANHAAIAQTSHGCGEDAEAILTSELEMLVEIQQAMISELLAEPSKPENSIAVHQPTCESSAQQPQKWCDIEDTATKHRSQPVHSSVLTQLENVFNPKVTSEFLINKSCGNREVVAEVLLNEHSRMGLVTASWRLGAPEVPLRLELGRSKELNATIGTQIDELRMSMQSLEDRQGQLVATAQELRTATEALPQLSQCNQSQGSQRDIVDVISSDHARVARQVSGGRFAGAAFDPHRSCVTRPTRVV